MEETAQTAESARQKAAVLETQGAREAAVLETAGVREADVRRAEGSRDAAALEALGQREAAILRTEGQRTVNIIWETTQMKVALSVTWGSLVVASTLAVFGHWLGSQDLQLASMVFLYGVANLVTGFYFGRTNHARTGGIGGESVRDDR